MFDDIRKIVGTVAPFIGSLLPTPFGTAAGKLIGKILLGNEDASESDIEKAILNATPEQLIQLKKVDSEYKTKMAQLGIDKQKIAQLDRDSARNREIILNDNIPSILAIMLTVGFFGILIGIMVYPIQPSAKSVIDIMLGSLGTAWISVVTYYFGSSSGSKIKTELLRK